MPIELKEVYQKALATIEDSAPDDKPHGGFIAVLSTPSLDRDGDRLLREEWVEPLPERLPLDIDHGMNVADTVGSFRPYFEGDVLMMDATFASTPKAQEVRTLVQEGHIGTVSVAFMTDKSQKDGQPKRELLNAGIVGIPSNRDAVILASKACSALKDALSDATEGDVPEEIKAAVLEALGPTIGDEKSVGDAEKKAGAVYIDILPRIDEEAFIKAVADVLVKAGATASGVGGDGALVQAIHDASSHLGAACPVIEVAPDNDSGASSGANKDVDKLEAFEKGLDEVLTPEDSPADEEPAPAVEAAAASDEAADEKAKRARRLRIMQMTSQFH